MKSKFILIFVLIIQGISFGQHMPKSSFENDITISPDSLFEKFISPEIPYIDSKYINSIYGQVLIFCDVFVDTNNKVSKITICPLKGVNNSIPDNDTIWDSIKYCIETVSKEWIFKSFVYDTSEFKNSIEKENFININNSKSKRRPFGGKQHHMILFKYDIDFRNSSPDLLYIINVGLQLPE